jgi:hypothetical protein
LMCQSDKLVLHVDNSTAVHAINNPGYYGRLMHLDVQHKFVMELYKNKVFGVEWCRTAEMLADCFTKPSSGVHLESFYREVMNRGDNETDPKWLLHMHLDYDHERRVLKVDQEAY